MYSNEKLKINILRTIMGTSRFTRLLITLLSTLVVTSCDIDDIMKDLWDKDRPNNNGSDENVFGYVDLGLSVKWATMNVGAQKITDYGHYFAWGETSSKDEYDWTSYKYSESNATKMTKYNSSSLGSVLDFKTELEYSDDAATINIGDNWRTPTLEEANELLQNCTWTWTDSYKGSEVAGYIVKSNVTGFTDKSIFLPAGGHLGGKNAYDTNDKGMYWTSTLDKTSFANIKACQLYFGSGGSVETMSYDREIGMTIRAVYGEKKEEARDFDISGTIQGHDFVDLGLSVQWATCNIGADIPKQGGNLYSWAETETKDIFSDKTYKYAINGSYDFMSKYNAIDSITILESIDDAATVNWGKEWRTPTMEEFKELDNNCEWYQGTNCIYGISNKNGKIIVISTTTGCRDDLCFNNKETGGYYWTANRGSDIQRAYSWINNGYYSYFTGVTNRYFGYAIRPVLNSSSENSDSTSK